MHRADVSNQMPYSDDEMRTYIKFDYAKPSNKTVKQAKIKVYAKVENISSGSVPVDTTLPLMLFSSSVTGWEENTLTWDYVASRNSFAFYSWDGLGGVIYNETLYGLAFEKLHVTGQFIQGTSRFQEIAALCKAKYYTKAKDMILRFAE